MLKPRNVIQPAKPPQHTNQQLIPIYTDWANRYLQKFGRALIHDLTEDLRDPKTLVNLVDAVTFGCPATSQSTLLCSLNATTPVDCIGKCLHYLAGLGVNVANLKAEDLHQGHLGETLALLFALSHYKQLHRQHGNGQCASPQHLNGPGTESKIAKVTVTANNFSAMKIPTPAGKKSSSLAKPEAGLQKPSSPSIAKASASKLIVPSAIARKVPTPTTTPVISQKEEDPAPKPAPPKSRLSSLAPPSTTATSSRLKIPVKSPSSRLPSAHGSTTNLATSNLSSTSTASTTSASSTLANANGHVGSNLKGPSTGPSFLRHRSSSATVAKEIVPTTLKPTASSKSTPESKIIKKVSNIATVKTTPSIEPSRVQLDNKPPPALDSKLSAPSQPKVVLEIPQKSEKLPESQTSAPHGKLVPPSSKLGPPTKLKRPTEGQPASKMMSWLSKGRKSESNKTQKTTVPEHKDTPQKREEHNPEVKPLQVAEKKSKLAVPTKNEGEIRESHVSSEDSAYGDTLTTTPSPRSSLSTNSSTHSSTSSLATYKPTSISPSAVPETIPEVPVDKLVDDSGVSSDATNPYETVVRNSVQEKPTLAVKGVMSRNRSEEPKRSDERVSEPRELKSEADEVKISTIGVVNAEPKRSRNGRKLHKTEAFDAKDLDLQDMPVPPPPLRLSSDLLLSSNKQEPAAGLIKFEAMKSQVDDAKTIRRVMRLAYRHRERHDSLEDSSSISSGLSENLDDISTDDLTGSSLSDHNMTATTSVPIRAPIYSRASKQAGFESSAQREQQRKLVEQQQSVVEELLQKSRSSQRGLAFQNSVQSTSSEFGRVYHTLHGAPPTLSAQRPPQVQLSADGDTLNVRGHNITPNFAPSVHYNCHSLDRQGHLKTYLEPQRHHIQQSAYSEISRPSEPPYMASMTQRNNDRSSHARSASVSSSPSQMSRSMIFYESDTNINNNNPKTLTSRERLYAEMMAAVASSRPNRSLSRASPRPGRAYFSLAPEGRTSRNGSLSARLPGSEYGSRSNLRLHKLGAELHCSPRSQPTFVRLNNQSMGSQMSLTHRSESPYANFDHQQELHRLNDEMNSYCKNLYNQDHTLQQFEAGLETIKMQVQKVCKKNPSQAEALMQRIEELRTLSVELTRRDPSLKRHPSVESVQSYASFRGNKNVDKNGILTKAGKKSWIRSSFSRAFKGKKQKSEDKGSTTKLNEIDDDVIQLKLELEEKDRQLGDVRLEALDKARELDMLRETVNRLKNENKALKHTTVLLERRAIRTESRASSRQSLSTCCHEEDQLENSSIPERSCSSSTSSKRSSGGLNARVLVEVDTSGSMEFGVTNQELNIGSLSVVSPTTTWKDMDRQLQNMLDDYMRRIDPGQKLGLIGQNSIIGYQITAENVRDIVLDKAPMSSPHELITPSVVIRLKLKGAAQESMDSLVLESLFPGEVLQKLLNLLLKSRRLVINGPTGIGKSNLSRFLAKYLAAKQKISPANLKDFNFPLNDYEKQFGTAKKELEELLKLDEDNIVMIDNTPRKAVDVLCSAFSAADELFSLKGGKGPFVIITLNKTSDLQLHDLQLNYNVHIFSLYCQMEPIKGFLSRYLRRRIAQEELTGHCKCGEQLQTVLDFLTRTLQIINEFIKDVNSLDTIGPRIFLRCPLSMEQSRVWFIRLWNTNIIPYLAKVVRENDSSLESDPTPLVNERWPWLDGIGGECELKTIREEMAKGNNSYSGSQASAIDAIYALDLFQEKRNGKHQPQIIGVL
ncbi:unnamed protein product [Bursaphelenchus xylophilus]|uniref:(pine wood nematode) hypothetical protein n=1 Tax=Bursaphelenchus xylophilus TaxID=6326 RepID=A0A1I7RPI2_BURXY|nr:unnamed protein product [Bursaphelenchus xylophilus]CAG9096064.1 unnamed protein product [Bursaphelenchus xylophilus]